MADKTTSEKRKREVVPREDDKSAKTCESDERIGTKKLKTQYQEVRDEIKDKFKFEMPQDFYDFWEFCATLNASHPEEALKDTLNLELVGPYDVFTGKLNNCDESNMTSYHLHWRYCSDPPEFQTILRSCDDDSGFHLGYFRDDPKSLPVFLTSNDANVGCEMTIRGDNIFGAVSTFLSETLKKCKEKSKKDSLKNLQTKITNRGNELNYSLSSTTPSIKSRNKLVNTKTFHKAGMVVPVDASDVGYRPLTVTDGELKRILKKICESKGDSEDASEQLQEIITYVQFANDECDYGMGLELGLDIFCFGEKRFHNLILQLMPLAYNLLGRDLFAEIIEVHMKYRDRENLSVIT